MSISLPPLMRGWRAALLLAAAALSTPGTASAGCGDYITYPNLHANGHGKPPARPDAHGTIPTPSRAPCQGPSCSSGPVREFPAIPPAPVANPTKEQARPFLLPDGDCGNSRNTFDRDSDNPRPIHRADPIFHPPRLV